MPAPLSLPVIPALAAGISTSTAPNPASPPAMPREPCVYIFSSRPHGAIHTAVIPDPPAPHLAAQALEQAASARLDRSVNSEWRELRGWKRRLCWSRRDTRGKRGYDGSGGGYDGKGEGRGYNGVGVAQV